jgi:hypothetical protein
MPSFDEEKFANWVSSFTPEELNIKSYGQDAVRLSNLVRGAIADGYGNVGLMAFRLDNGASNDHVYEAREDCVADSMTDLSLSGSRCGYVKIPHDDLPPKAARTYIDFCRKADKAGFRMTDPDDYKRQLIIPNREY